MIYDRAHHRDLNRFGGLKEPMPLYGGMSAILFFASMGLPGLCGFVGEFFVVMAAWNFSPALAIPGDAERDPDGGLPALDVAARLPRHQPGDAGLPRPQPARGGVPVAVRGAGDLCWASLPQTLIFNWVDPSVTGWVANMSVLK